MMKNANNNRVKRGNTAADIIITAVLTVALAAVLVAVSGASPARAAVLFGKGVFGNLSSFMEVFVKACPLILTGLGCAVAFRSGFFNIGAEGQFYTGAMAGTIVVLYVPLPGVLRIVAAIAAGFAFGGAYALIAAVLKARFNISEIIVTIMLNYIAINFLGYAVRSFLQAPGGNVPESAKIDPAFALRPLIRATRFHAGVFVAFAAVIFLYFLLEKTTTGFEMKAVGLNKRASSCLGINAAKNIVLSAFISGGLAGIAGVIEVIAIQKKLLEGISGNSGYTGVLIALIAVNNPFFVLVAALVYALLQVGAGAMQRQLGVPSSVVSILIGAVVIFILIRDLYHRKKAN